MAKLILFITTFAIFLLLANASIYRTSIEIHDDIDDSDLEFLDEENRHGQKPPSPTRCSKEFQAHQQLRACQRFLRNRVTSPSYIEEVVEDSEENHHELLQNCCKQLRQIDAPCRCPSLKYAVQQQIQTRIVVPPPAYELQQSQDQPGQGQQGQGQSQGQQGQGQQGQGQGQGQQGQGQRVERLRMYNIAAKIPKMCKIQPTVCAFPRVAY